MKNDEHKELTAKKIAVMQAYVDGKSIEYERRSDSGKWRNVSQPQWDWVEMRYRVKPEISYIPFTFDDAEFLIGRTVKHKTASEVFMLVEIRMHDVQGISYSQGISYAGLLENYVFVDGSPCGKLKQ